MRALIAAAWLSTVLLSYYVANYPYYREKVETFGSFLIGGSR